MNEEGQLEPSFGWRATLVMSLRGFQLFHLRSKRRRRLLLLLLFSLTFYTVTSFDRGWGREGERAPDSLEQAPAVRSFLSRTDKPILSFFLLTVFVIKLLLPVHATLAFSLTTSPAQD